MPNDPRMGSSHTGMIVRLAKAKTGLNQSVSLESEQVQVLLYAYLRAHPFRARDRIFPFSPASFRMLIRRVARTLGLHGIPYVPHSFRHGGATHAFQRGARIEDIMYRGRWVSLESARRYIQTARALLIMLDIPSSLNQTGVALAPHIGAVIQHLMTAVPLARHPRRVRFRLE